MRARSRGETDGDEGVRRSLGLPSSRRLAGEQRARCLHARAKLEPTIEKSTPEVGHALVARERHGEERAPVGAFARQFR